MASKQEIEDSVRFNLLCSKIFKYSIVVLDFLLVVAAASRIRVLHSDAVTFQNALIVLAVIIVSLIAFFVFSYFERVPKDAIERIEDGLYWNLYAEDEIER